MAAEPLVASPVAIDFGPDGRLWVAEMLDYPAGIDGKYKPGGRIKVLESTKGDGIYDKATVFLDNIPFPTGVTPWRKGVLVCAAPDILYAEDTTPLTLPSPPSEGGEGRVRGGGGKADVVKKLFSGWATHNYQARVNGLEYGLDGWVYGSGGIFGGDITSFSNPKPVPLTNRDFRINPDTGVIEAAAGRSQHGRVRNDWGDWFGCDNSTFLRHYPLADHYLRRNPHVAAPNNDVIVTDYPDWNRCYPLQNSIQLFKLSGPPGRATAACGVGIYRDDLLGKEYTGNSFTCEPVNLLVRRLVLTPKGSTFSARRAPDEQQSEFLASSDSWFRPVQARTGPDGCLWIVDMHRYVIEHPRWIPPEDLAKVETRAGSTMGRIYRVRPKNTSPRPIPRLDKLDMAGLVAALDSPNGWQRDMAGQMLIWRNDRAAIVPLQRLATGCVRPETRLQAMNILDGLGHLQASDVEHALGDSHPGVRRHAVRLTEKFLGPVQSLGPILVKLADDSDAQVRLQVAFSLGAWSDHRAGEALAALSLSHPDDPYLTSAVLSSVNRDNVAQVMGGLLISSSAKPPPEELMRKVVAIGMEWADLNNLPNALAHITRQQNGRFQRWQLAALAGFLDALTRQGKSLEKLTDHEQVDAMVAECLAISADSKASEPDRIAAIGILGRQPDQRDADLTRLSQLLVPQNSAAIQSAALTGLGRISDDRVADLVISGWSTQSPALKSQVLDLLLMRKEWQRKLMTALGKREIPPAQIDAARRLRLLENRDAAIRAAAAKLFEGATNTDRQKVVQNYRDVITMTGDTRRGKEAFAKRCSVCHRL